MNTFPTTDIPLGSTAAKVLYNNASNFDEFSVSELPTFIDRFLKIRKTIAGMEMDFQDFLLASGYQYVGADYIDGVPGLVFSARNMYTVRAGIAYRPAATATIPFVTTGDWVTDQPLFVAFDTDSQFAGDLANNSDPAKGAALVGYAGRTVYARLQDEVNVLDFGADPTGVQDSLAAFNAARDKLQTNSYLRGGKIRIPAGNYKLSNTWLFTPYAPGVVHNMTIEGDGIQCTTLIFTTAPALSDGISFTGPGAQLSISGLTVDSAKRRGVSITDCNQWQVSDLRIQNCVGAGFYTFNSWLGNLERVWCKSNGGGFSFAGVHTSITAYRCYASESTVGSAGWAINGVTYSSFVSCASDVNDQGFAISNCRGLVFSGCGTESNRKEGWFLFSSNASQAGIPSEYLYISGVELIGCVAYFNSTSSPGSYGNFLTAAPQDANPIQFAMKNCGSARASGLDASVILAATGGPLTYRDDDARHDGPYVFSGTLTAAGYLENLVTTGNALALTNSVSRNITSLVLPAGDWLVEGNILFVPTGSTSVIGYYAGLSTTSGNLGTEEQYSRAGEGFSRVSPQIFNLLTPSVRIRSNGATTVYLVANAAFSASTLAASGKILARKL